VPAAEAVIRESCYLYFGWRNQCDGCNNPPSKWGRASHDACIPDQDLQPQNNTCSTMALGGVTLWVFGLNTDKAVDDDDKFYFGFHCR
jgi:hypothetical protein